MGASLADTMGIKLRTEVLFLHPDVIERDPDQPREEFDPGGLARLAASLRKFGQLQPVLVRKVGARYVLVAGERRWRAARSAGMATLQCLLCRGGDSRSIQLIENLMREDLKPVEQAKAFRAIMDQEGWTARELARQLSLEHSGVARALRLTEQDPEIQGLVDAGKVPPTTAYEISKRPKSQQVKLARQAAAGKIKGDDLRRKPAPKSTLVLNLGGVAAAWSHRAGKVQVQVTGHRTQDDVVAALKAALAAAEAAKGSLAGGRGRR